VARIGILHLGLHGHLRPAARLGRALAARGHDVVAWAPEEVRELVEQGGVELRPEGAVIDGVPNRNFMLGAALAAMNAVEEVETVIERLHRDRVDLVVYDCMSPNGRLAAEWLGLPSVCSVPLFPPGPGWVIGPDDRRASANGPENEELLKLVNDCREEIGLTWGVELGGLRDMSLNAGDLNLVYTTPELAGAAPRDDSWRFVGPLLDPLEPAPAREPDAPPLVYMALGTMFSNQPAVFQAGIDALADEDVHLLVSTGGRVDPATFEPLPPNATVVTHVASRAVLSNSAVHITHGGANSVHESLAAGVPMVCIPQGADNWSWAQRIAELGVGQVLTDPTAGTVRDAVTGLLRDTEAQRQAAGLGARLAEYPGAAIAADAVDGLLAHA
jgi:MGT family glycosyltransferase